MLVRVSEPFPAPVCTHNGRHTSAGLHSVGFSCRTAPAQVSRRFRIAPPGILAETSHRRIRFAGSPGFLPFPLGFPVMTPTGGSHPAECQPGDSAGDLTFARPGPLPCPAQPALHSGLPRHMKTRRSFLSGSGTLRAYGRPGTPSPGEIRKGGASLEPLRARHLPEPSRMRVLIWSRPTSTSSFPA